jgi:hypothetical protein
MSIIKQKCLFSKHGQAFYSTESRSAESIKIIFAPPAFLENNLFRKCIQPRRCNEDLTSKGIIYHLEGRKKLVEIRGKSYKNYEP